MVLLAISQLSPFIEKVHPIESPLPTDFLWEVWLKLAQLFHRQMDRQQVIRKASFSFPNFRNGLQYYKMVLVPYSEVLTLPHALLRV